MLSQLDNIIYPDRCEVYEVIPSQRYVYVIFKNGHSSISTARQDNGWKIILNEQIRHLNEIDIIIREPRGRLLSGLNTFIQQVLSSNPDLDTTTVTWFAKQYTELNRHYSSQFSWILNLARYIDPRTRLNLIGVSEIKTITSYWLQPLNIKPMPDDFSDTIGDLSAFEYPQRIDQIIYNQIGKSLTFAELVDYIKNNDYIAYQKVVEKSLKIIKPLYVLSKT
jgi:hypothetical protein